MIVILAVDKYFNLPASLLLLICEKEKTLVESASFWEFTSVHYDFQLIIPTIASMKSIFIGEVFEIKGKMYIRQIVKLHSGRCAREHKFLGVVYIGSCN